MGEQIKELKTTADLGYKAFMKLNDFTDPKEIAHSFKDSNVVINCIGPKVWETRENRFEESAIRVPVAIAKAVKANP